MKRFDRTSYDIGQQILNAPFVDNGWDSALRALASHTRSGRGELITFGEDNSVPFNLITDLSPEAHAEFLEIEGGRPDRNVRLASAKGPFEIAYERDYDEARTRINSALYDDYSHKYDMLHGCQSVLSSERGLMVGLAVIRSRAEGRTTEEDRQAFADLAPYVLTAVRLQRSVKQQGAKMIAGAFEAMEAAAFILDGTRFVQAQTSAATALLRADRRLTVTTGRIAALLPDDDRRLQMATSRALRSADEGGPGHARIVLRGEGRDPLDSLMVEVFPLPRQEWALGFEPRLLLSVKRPRSVEAGAREILADLLGLTTAEAEVAMLAAQGYSRDLIALRRGTSTETVSTQLKSLFRKADVNRESELVAFLNRLMR